MLIRRIARPMLSAVFIGQGVEALLNPKPAAQAAQPTVDGLQALPDQVSSNIPADPETFAQINAAAQPTVKPKKALDVVLTISCSSSARC